MFQMNLLIKPHLLKNIYLFLITFSIMLFLSILPIITVIIIQEFLSPIKILNYIR